MHFMDFIPAELETRFYTHVPTALYWQERVKLDLDFSPAFKTELLQQNFADRALKLKEHAVSVVQSKRVMILT